MFVGLQTCNRSGGVKESRWETATSRTASAVRKSPNRVAGEGEQGCPRPRYPRLVSRLGFPRKHHAVNDLPTFPAAPDTIVMIASAAAQAGQRPGGGMM